MSLLVKAEITPDSKTAKDLWIAALRDDLRVWGAMRAHKSLTRLMEIAAQVEVANGQLAD